MCVAKPGPNRGLCRYPRTLSLPTFNVLPSSPFKKPRPSGEHVDAPRESSHCCERCASGRSERPTVRTRLDCPLSWLVPALQEEARVTLDFPGATAGSDIVSLNSSLVGNQCVTHAGPSPVRQFHSPPSFALPNGPLAAATAAAEDRMQLGRAMVAPGAAGAARCGSHRGLRSKQAGDDSGH